MQNRTFIDPVLDSIDSVLAWFSTELKQTVESYCDLETADDPYTLVARDGSLISVIRVFGVTKLIGQDEFDSADKQYFPQIGDSEAVIKQKAANRRQVTNTMLSNVGPKGEAAKKTKPVKTNDLF